MRKTLVALFLIAAVVVPRTPAQAAGVRVGVLDSTLNHQYMAERGIDSQGRVAAVFDTLSAAGFNVELVGDALVADAALLSQFDVVVLPYVIALNEQPSMNLRNFVADGGGLVPILGTPRVFQDPAAPPGAPLHTRWPLWVLEMNYEAWEWGPLSEAYQKMFINDPSPSSLSILSEAGSHPITSATLSDLGISSIRFDRTTTSGAEFSTLFNSNVDSLLRFDIHDPVWANFDGYTAAQAISYGYGRIVYFDFSLIDFLPQYNATLASQTHQGISQGAIASRLIANSIDWAAAGGGSAAPIIRSARTWGEVDAWGTSIYVRQYATNLGNVAVTGDLTMRVFDPSGNLVASEVRTNLGIEPGRTHQYSWSYVKGSLLDGGQYRVEVSYRYTYPNYDLVHTEQALVVRSQGTNIPTAPVPGQDAWRRIADVNGDGKDDVVTYEPTSGEWQVHRASGSGFVAELWALFTTTGGWDPQLVGDFTGDGRDDVVSYHEGSGTWWVNRSTGSGFALELWATFSTKAGWSPQLVGDFTGDGRDDVVSYHEGSGTWWVNRSTGSGFALELWATFSTRSGWSPQLVGDFTGDGRDDVVSYHEGSGTWWVNRSTGSGFALELWATFSTRSGWSPQLVGDFTGDGRDDVVSYHEGSGTWWVNRSTGSGFALELWATFSTRSGWDPQLVGDFTGDGRDDVVSYHEGSGTWWVNRSTGSGFALELWATFSTRSGWDPQLVGDFTGDGRDDVVSYHEGSGTWWVNRSTGSAFTLELWAID